MFSNYRPPPAVARRPPMKRKVPIKLKPKRKPVAPRAIAKNPPSRRPRAITQAAPKPYDPYAPLAPSVIEENARARAQSQIQPELDDIASTGRDYTGANQSRQTELTGWYNNFQSNLDNSFNQTSDALNQLIALNNGGNREATDILSRALSGSNKGVSDAAAQIGGVATPQGNDADILAAAHQSSENQNNFVGAQALATLNAQGDRRGLAGIGRIEAGAAEQRRYDAQAKELQNQRTAVNRRLPDLTSAARAEIQDREAQKMGMGEAKQNRLFQQYLAEKELGLKSRNQTFQEWLGSQQLGLDKRKQSSQEKVDWANIGLGKAQLREQIRQFDLEAAGGGPADKKERAKLRAGQWATGLEMLDTYTTPAKGEAAPGEEVLVPDDNGVTPKLYRRSFDDALRMLTGRAKMSKSDALKMMSTYFPSWRSRAQGMLADIKNPPTRATLKKTTKKSMTSVAKTARRPLTKSR